MSSVLNTPQKSQDKLYTGWVDGRDRGDDSAFGEKEPASETGGRRRLWTDSCFQSKGIVRERQSEYLN